MAKLGDQIAPRKDNESKYVSANNKMRIPNGTRKATIIDVWIHNVDKDRKFTKDKTDEQMVRIKVRYDARPDIVLEKRMRAYLSPKAKFAQWLQVMTGIAAGSNAMHEFDTIALLDEPLCKVFVTTVYDESSGYTNIESITPRNDDDDLGAVPPQTASAAQTSTVSPEEERGHAEDCVREYAKEHLVFEAQLIELCKKRYNGRDLHQLAVPELRNLYGYLLRTYPSDKHRSGRLPEEAGV